jgi:hypothetical protein
VGEFTQERIEEFLEFRDGHDFSSFVGDSPGILRIRITLDPNPPIVGDVVTFVIT